MSYKKAPNLNEFREDMLKFYRSSSVKKAEIKAIMKEYEDVIPHYLAATPELIARKMLYAHEHGEFFK